MKQKLQSVPMATDGAEYDRKGLVVPKRRHMVFKIALGPANEDRHMINTGNKTSVEIEVPPGSSSETLGTQMSNSHVGTSNGSTHGGDTWWSVSDFGHQRTNNRHNNSQSADDKYNTDDNWDMDEPAGEIDKESNKDSRQQQHSPELRKSVIDVDAWIAEDSSHGFVHVYRSDMDTHPRLFPCTLMTTAQKLCVQCSMPPNSLHVQFNGDIIRRLAPTDSPLAMQNEYLQNIGYTDRQKIQGVGALEDLSFLVKFYAGKPVSDSTYSRNQLSTFAYVRKGKLIYQWVRRLCVISGTRLLIYRDKNKTDKPTEVQLAKGSMEEIDHIKGHDHVLKLTSTLQGDRSVYLSFTEEKDFEKWIRKVKKATAKLPTKADLSNCHLEFLPENVFINDSLEILNLRHNVLKEQPIEEDIYTIGWLNDLPRFRMLRSLNLADNNLRSFPLAVCKMKMLTELNLASNSIEDVPPSIVDLEHLQMLHLHNNCLTYLPEEMCRMRSLLVLVLAFNHFTTIPTVLLQSPDSLLRIDSIIMAGNQIEKLVPEVLQRMQGIKKIDFRMNKLLFSPNEMAKFPLLELVTHLDIRDNRVVDLDVRALRNLEYLNCERNQIQSLQVSGGAIKTLLTAQNEITVFAVNPKPEWLVTLDLSHNKLEGLPSWISNCFFLVQLNASHNHLTHLPDRLLAESQKLKTVFLSHNRLTELPTNVCSYVLEELSLEHNLLVCLPDKFFHNLPRLRFLCLTSNQLETMPSGNPNVYLNKLQELYVSANQLGDDAIPHLTVFQKLKILHIAYNKITEIHDRDIRKLENLQELNVSGNMLRHLPRCLGKHSNIQALRCNANLLRELPDFRCSNNLKMCSGKPVLSMQPPKGQHSWLLKAGGCFIQVNYSVNQSTESADKILEVGSNRLIDVSVTNLMASNVNLLDISGNPEMQINSSELKGISNKKKVCMVDIKGQNRSLLDLRTAGFDEIQIPWQSGLSQTSGMRNKLSVSAVNRPKFKEGREALFALFDGGRTDEVINILSNQIADLLEQELEDPTTSQDYLKYTMLTAHRKLKGTGQKLGASGAVCHIQSQPTGSGHTLHVANIGDTEVVLCRKGEAVVLSKLFTVSNNKDEVERIVKSGGIITEDNRINGVTQSTRLLGSSYLFPFIIPTPHVMSTTLQPDDQLIILANQGLWKYISYQEAIDEIVDIPDPALAAKKLQDLAQGYRSQENIGVLVVRLMMSPLEKNRLRGLLQQQFEKEQKLLAELKIRDIDRDEARKKAELEEQTEHVPMDIVKLKGGRKRKQINAMFRDGEYGSDDLHAGDVRPLPDEFDNDDLTTNWEQLLQKRLTEEVKDKELIHAMRVNDLDTALTDSNPDNWSATTKLKGQMNERVVTLPAQTRKPSPASKASKVSKQFPPHVSQHRSPPPPPPHVSRHRMNPELSTSTESVEFQRELKHPLNVDRDAVLFHNMQLARSKSHNLSSLSIDSTQSVPAYPSLTEITKGGLTSSHSIEVLVHPPNLKLRGAEFGGSHKLPPPKLTVPKRESYGDSEPNNLTTEDRLRMLEDGGFLPKDSKGTAVEKGKNRRSVHFEEYNGVSGEKNVQHGKGINKTETKENREDNKENVDISTKTERKIGLSVNSTEQVHAITEAQLPNQKFNGVNMDKDMDMDLDKVQWKIENTTSKNQSKRARSPMLVTDEKSVPSVEAESIKTKGKQNVKGYNPKVNVAPVKKKDTVKNNSASESVHNHTDITDTVVTANVHAIPNERESESQTKTQSPMQENDPKDSAETDLNSNAMKSLEDLLTYNRLQQKKTSYKVHPKAAPQPPSKVPETSILTKTASQRSVVITYL